MAHPATQRPDDAHDLPEGGWVRFWHPRDLTGDDYEQVMSNVRLSRDAIVKATTIDNREQFQAMGAAEAMDALDLGPTETITFMRSYTRGMANVFIRDWDIPYTPKGTNYEPHHVPVPADDPTILGRLRLPDYETIDHLVRPLISRSSPGAVTVDDASVPGSPTVPAGDSAHS